MILWSFVGFLLIIWIAKLQRDHARERESRMDRQRRQRVGLEPIPGAHGQIESPDAEEKRLLAILKARREEGGR